MMSVVSEYWLLSSYSKQPQSQEGWGGGGSHTSVKAWDAQDFLPIAEVLVKCSDGICVTETVFKSTWMTRPYTEE